MSGEPRMQAQQRHVFGRYVGKNDYRYIKERWANQYPGRPKYGNWTVVREGPGRGREGVY